LFFKVFWQGTLVRSTEKSVLWNVRAGDVPVVIELDLAGTGLPVPGDPARPFLVRGRITVAGGAPVAGVTVLAVERGMREEAPLGQAETDAQGMYEIAYALGQRSEERREGRASRFWGEAYHGGSKRDERHF